MGQLKSRLLQRIDIRGVPSLSTNIFTSHLMILDTAHFILIGITDLENTIFMTLLSWKCRPALASVVHFPSINAGCNLL